MKTLKKAVASYPTSSASGSGRSSSSTKTTPGNEGDSKNKQAPGKVGEPEIIQWDRRKDVVDPSNTGMCFYCNDEGFTPILNNPKKYVDKLSKYACVVGIDPSPYDNMPLVVQKSQIYLNLAITYYYGSIGLKVIPNLRLGENRTLSCLEAFPKHTLIAIGTHGFTHRLDNRWLFADQVDKIISELEPTGIIVYGPASDDIFGIARLKSIPIYQYDSYTMKENKKDRERKLSEVKTDER